MSFTPTNEQAAAAYAALLTARPDGIAAITWGYGFANVDRDALRQVLIALHCPPPCVGVINDTGWHRSCEAAADRALNALGAEYRFVDGSAGSDDDPGDTTSAS